MEKKTLSELGLTMVRAGEYSHLVSDIELPVNGDKVIANNYGHVWDFKTEPSPMPYWANPKTCKKILYTTDPKLSLPMFEVEDEATEAWKIWISEQEYGQGNEISFIGGYKANPAKYTEEDMRKAFEAGRTIELKDYNPDLKIGEQPLKFKAYEDYDATLQPQYEVEVEEDEVQDQYTNGEWARSLSTIYKPKLTNNKLILKIAR